MANMIVIARSLDAGSTSAVVKISGQAIAPNASGVATTVLWECEVNYTDEQKQANRKMQHAAMAEFARLVPPISISGGGKSLVIGGAV